MRPSHGRVAVIVIALVFVACGSERSTAAVASTIASATPSSSPFATATSSPSRSPAPVPRTSVNGTPNPTASFVGSIATTLASDGLRVRSEPRVSDDSLKLEPLLPLGSPLYVLQGPVSASGYSWFEVVPLASRNLPSGWVASADRDGTPWIGAGDFDCPPMPTDVRSLAALAPGVGLACFPRAPITVEGLLIECNCDVDGPWYSPNWFYLASGSPALLVGAESVTVPPDSADWLALSLDPTGEHPDVLPIGRRVQVTGMFDHPAASRCTRTDMDGEPMPSQGCRLVFAVTQLLLFGP